MIDLNDVLLAMSNIPVDDPIAEIWGRGLQSGYKIIEYTGSLPITINANGDALLDYRIYGNTEQTGTPTPENPIMSIGCGERTENLVFDGWAEDFVTRVATASAYITQVDGRTCLHFFCNAGYREYDTKYMFKTDFKESTVHTLSFVYMRPSNFTISSTIQVRYTDGTGTQITSYINDGDWHKLTYVTASGKTIKDICVYYSSGWVYIDVNTFMVAEGSTALPYEPYGYKLPMTVSDGNTVQSVPVYIGDTPLDENEYVSFGEQKIYRDASGTLTPTDPPVPLPEIPTIDGETVIDYDGDPKPSQMYVKYKGKAVQ